MIKEATLDDIHHHEKSFFYLADGENADNKAIKEALQPCYQMDTPINKNSIQQTWVGSNFNWADNIPQNDNHNQFKIISYHTDDDLYRENAQQLKKSLEENKLDYVIKERSSRGGWEENCAQKAEFVFEQWEASTLPVIWLDSDAFVKSYPYLFSFLHQDVDFAIHKVDRWEFLANVIYFNKTEVTYNLLKLWKKKCQKEPKIWDQIHLDFAWHEIRKKEKIRTLWLPPQYSKIIDKDIKNSVIDQHQTSRRLDEINIKKRKKVRRIRAYQRSYRKLEMTPPPLSRWDKFLDLF